MTDPTLRLVDKAAEQAVNGAILIDPDALERIADLLGAEDFHDERARWVYDAAYTLYQQQRPIDTLTLCEELERAGHLHEIGGAAYLTTLIQATPTSMHVADYARTVNRLAMLRRLVQIAGQIAQMAYNANGSADGIVEKVRALVDGVSPMTSTEDVLLWLDSLERFAVAQLARNDQQVAVEQGERRAPLTLPWKAFERFKLRLRPGTMALVIAGSSVGKTTFMECCAEFWARLGYRVAFFHLELSHQMMLDRRMARLTGIPIDEIEAGCLNDSRIADATAQMRGYSGGITYVHCPAWTARAVATKARQLYSKGLCDALVVDYLQKLRLYRPRGTTTNDALADAAEVLKNTAEQLAIPCMMGSQVNRRSEDATRVTGDHLRGSGEVPEKANVAITLRRDVLPTDQMCADGTVYQAGSRSPEMDVRIDKNTLGPTGDCALMINGSRFLITDVSYRQEV